jgi:hypothetical protein
MPTKLTGRDGVSVTIPDGGHGLQGTDGHMVAIPRGHKESKTRGTRRAYAARQRGMQQDRESRKAERE